MSYNRAISADSFTHWTAPEGATCCRCQVFSSRTGDAVYEFPWFSRFRAALEGVLDQVTSQLSMLRRLDTLLRC